TASRSRTSPTSTCWPSSGVGASASSSSGGRSRRATSPGGNGCSTRGTCTGCTRSSASGRRASASWSETLGQVPERQGVAPRDPAVLALEELEEDVLRAELLAHAAEGLGAEIEEVLVRLARVDVDGSEPAHGVRPRLRESHGIPAKPPFPDVRPELAAREVERHLHRPVLVGRVRGGHAPGVDELEVARLRDPGTSAEVLPEAFERPVVPVAQGAAGRAEVRQVAVLEERVAGVRRERA